MAAAPPSDRPTNLPAPLTRLVGRERELDAVCALLRRGDVRLLILTGGPAAGRLRLFDRRRLAGLRIGRGQPPHDQIVAHHPVHEPVARVADLVQLPADPASPGALRAIGPPARFLVGKG